jgi:anti-anti-sigma factor
MAALSTRRGRPDGQIRNRISRLIFTLWGELDMASVPQLEVGDLDAVKAGPLNFDLSDLTFMDSTGLRASLHVAKALQSGRLILHGVQNEVRKVLDISGLQVLPNAHIIPLSP